MRAVCLRTQYPTNEVNYDIDDQNHTHDEKCRETKVTKFVRRVKQNFRNFQSRRFGSYHQNIAHDPNYIYISALILWFNFRNWNRTTHWNPVQFGRLSNERQKSIDQAVNPVCFTLLKNVDKICVNFCCWNFHKYDTGQ